MARVMGHLRQTFVAGILLIVPVFATIYILWFLFTSLDGLLSPAIERAFGVSVTGLGLAALLVLVYLIGLIGRNFVGRRIFASGQQLLMRLPLVRTVYAPARQLIESFSGVGATGFKRVVIIEYPSAGLRTIGFLTGTFRDEHGEVQALVYIPTAPTPNSGWVALLPLSQVYDTDLSVPDAIRLVLSGGILTPGSIRKTQAG